MALFIVWAPLCTNSRIIVVMKYKKLVMDCGFGKSPKIFGAFKTKKMIAAAIEIRQGRHQKFMFGSVLNRPFHPFSSSLSFSIPFLSYSLSKWPLKSG